MSVQVRVHIVAFAKWIMTPRFAKATKYGKPEHLARQIYLLSTTTQYRLLDVSHEWK